MWIGNIDIKSYQNYKELYKKQQNNFLEKKEVKLKKMAALRLCTVLYSDRGSTMKYSLGV